MRLIGPDERMSEKRGCTIVVIGPTGVGKTSLLKTLDDKTLASTLLVDIESGSLPVAHLPIASVRPRTWKNCADIACAVGGPDPAAAPNAIYSQAHYDKVIADPELAGLARYELVFVDSITRAGVLSFQHCEQLPEAYSDRGKKDLRSVYGAHARNLLGWLHEFQHAPGRVVVFVAILEKVVDDFHVANWQPQLQGEKSGRELGGIVDQIATMTWVDFGDQKPVRAFVCTSPNPWSYPAKDRSGRLDQLEPPDLQKLLDKILVRPPAPETKET